MEKKIQSGFYIDVWEENGENNTKLIVSDFVLVLLMMKISLFLAPSNFMAFF